MSALACWFVATHPAVIGALEGDQVMHLLEVVRQVALEDGLVMGNPGAQPSELLQLTVDQCRTCATVCKHRGRHLGFHA